MALYGKGDNANSAPGFAVNDKGQTGKDLYGTSVFLENGNWVYKTQKGNRTYTELLIGGVEARAGTWWTDGASWGWDATTNRFMRLGRPVSQTQAVSSFLRSTAAYNTTDNVYWSSSAVNTIRRSSAGTLFEKSATNRLLRSNDLMVSPWTLTGTATRATTSIPAPAYGNFFRISRNSETDILIHQQTTTFTVGADTVASAFVMGEGSDIGKRVAIEIKRQAGGTYIGQTVVVTLTAQPQRIWATFKPAADNTSIAIAIKTSASGGTRADTVLVACPQMEAGVYPSSPIETSAVAGTRAVDQLSMNLPTTSNLSVTYSTAITPIQNSTLSYRGLSYTVHKDTDSTWTLGRRYETSDVLRFEVRPGDVWTNDTVDKERSELTTSTSYAKNTFIWNAHAFKIGSGFTASTEPGSWFILGQWHGNSDADGRSPYIAINLIGNALVITRRYYTGSGQSSAIEMYRQENFPRDTWFNIAIQHKVVDATNGVMNVWLAQEGQAATQIVNYTGAVGYWDHPLAGYWKFGIYRQAAAFTGVVEYQNNEEGTSDLSARVTTPLTIDNGVQIINAVPTNGVYALDTTVLNHNLIQKIEAL